jgi:hypothetical protein
LLPQRREDGSWRWEERDYAACVYEQVHRPLLKSNSRKLSSLPPVEVRVQKKVPGMLAGITVWSTVHDS